MDKEHAGLVELARRAAHEASKAILEIYRGDIAVRVKDDRTPVTLADEKAEAIIVAILKEGAPGIPVIAEEEMAAQGAPGAAPARFWLVDPLDGTREFINRNGEFTINIGLVEGTRVTLGVVHLPATGETYAGCGPGTATRQASTGAPATIAARAVPAAGAVIVHSRSHADAAKIESFAAAYPGNTRRHMGSAAKFCLLAAGEADLYPRLGRTMEWDTGAGQAVLEAAGGSVVTLAGAPLAYAKPGYANPDFIAKGRTV